MGQIPNHEPAEPALWQILQVVTQFRQAPFGQPKSRHRQAVILHSANDAAVLTGGVEPYHAFRALLMGMFHDIVESFCQNLFADVANLARNATRLPDGACLLQRIANCEGG